MTHMFRKIRKFSTNVSKNVVNMGRRGGRKPRQDGAGLDEIDRKVLKALMSDPRMSLRDIAAVTSTSVGAVREHISSLQRSGVIRGYTAIVDPFKAGYKITAVIEIFESKKGLGLVENAVRAMPNVCAVYSVTGGTDVIAIARFMDSEELNNFVRRVLRMRNVSRTETLIVLDTYKEDFRPRL